MLYLYDRFSRFLGRRMGAGDAAHRQALPTPRGNGKNDPEGDAARLPVVVARSLWWIGTTARRAPSRKPCSAVVVAQHG